MNVMTILKVLCAMFFALWLYVPGEPPNKVLKMIFAFLFMLLLLLCVTGGVPELVR